MTAITELLESGLHSDVTLAAGGEKFRAHKAILAARSPVFQAMLKGNKASISTVKIHDVEPAVLRELLRSVDRIQA